MKILAFVDVHTNSLALRELGKKARDADILVCAGDMSVFSQGLRETMTTMNSWGKPCLVIHGNHEDEDETSAMCAELPNLQFIHGREVQIGALTFTGWGGGGFSRRDLEFEQFAKSFKPDASRILITHAPPYGTAIDFQPYMGEHVGCQSFTDAIERLQPALALAGHIHECFGEHEKCGRTVILNPGPLGVMIELEAKAAEKPKASAKKTAKKKGGKL